MDLFVFMIVAFIILVICGLFLYIGNISTVKLHESMDGMSAFQGGSVNVSEVIDNTMGKTATSYQTFYWLSLVIIVGMILSIFIGSYLVTTKPVFFVPYIFVVIFAVVVSVGISNAYEQVINNPTLASTFAGFVGANFIMSKLPIWVTVIGFVGAIIMFSRIGSKENVGGFYG